MTTGSAGAARQLQKKRLSQRDDLGHLLGGEREPAAQRIRKIRLERQVVGHVQQRARRADRHNVGGHGGQPGQGVGRVGPPHVAAGHHAGHDDLAGHVVRFAGHEVERDRPRPAPRRAPAAPSPRSPKYEATSTCGRSLATADPPVRASQRVQLRRRPVLDERRLVQLHPVDAFGGQRGQKSTVDVDDLVQPVQPAPARKQQERHRADHYRARRVTEPGGLAYLGHRLGGVERQRPSADPAPGTM